MIERREKIIKKLIFSYNISIRTVSSLKHNCSYVPNVLAFDTPQSIRSNRAKCAKCHIFGTFGTPNTKNLIYQMFQILLFLPHMNSTLTNLPLYGQLWHKFLLFFYSAFSLISPSVSPSNSNPLLSNPTLSLCLPLPVSLGAVALLGLGASVLTKTPTFATTFSAFGDPILWLIALTFFFALEFIKTGLGSRNCLPARRWRESDFQHDQADDRVYRLGQGGDCAWVGVVDCWGDL